MSSSYSKDLRVLLYSSTYIYSKAYLTYIYISVLFRDEFGECFQTPGGEDYRGNPEKFPHKHACVDGAKRAGFGRELNQD